MPQRTQWGNQLRGAIESQRGLVGYIMTKGKKTNAMRIPQNTL